MVPSRNQQETHEGYILKCPPQCFVLFVVSVLTSYSYKLLKAVLRLGNLSEMVLYSAIPLRQNSARAAWVFLGVGGTSLTHLTPENTSALVTRCPHRDCAGQSKMLLNINWPESPSRGRSARRVLVYWTRGPVIALGSVSSNVLSSVNSENTSLSNTHIYLHISLTEAKAFETILPRLLMQSGVFYPVPSYSSSFFFF